MNNFQVDLTNCDREPIHIPGKIQSHGFLLAINATNYHITYASENVNHYLGVTPTSILGQKISVIDELLPGNDELELLALLKLGTSHGNFDIINPYKIFLAKAPFYLIIHRSADNFILEFEPSTLEIDLQQSIGKSVSSILANKGIDRLLSRAAEEVKQLIGYDRVMVYKFQEDDHGEVVAEVKNDELEPFFGLHYPASDIPKQARELYKLNLIRIISDVESTASEIATYNNDIPLDLTCSTLRAVSPIHIQYLKNMGVCSSFSISLLSKGELWGLIACHNYSPKFIDYKAREGSKLLGQILSSALEYREEEENTDRDSKIKDAINEIGVQLNKDPDIISALTKYHHSLLGITSASGVALSYEGEWYFLGTVPEKTEIDGLTDWLKANMHDSIYYTHQLPEAYKPAKNFATSASGILTVMLSKELGELIIFFKPEQLQTIHWAGNPEKPAELNADGIFALSPRQSFESWAQIVRNTSNKWSKAEISGVLKVRETIINTIHKKANEIRMLNEKLKQAYDELDTFSYTISHDLRTPLTSIKSYTELFLARNSDIDQQGKKLLDRVINGADKMGYLINEILKLARVGRTDLESVKINMSVLIEDVVTEINSALKADHVKISIGDCPSIYGDEILISQVFTNLIGNAVKYSAKSDSPQVSITGTVDGDEIIYMVSDNGIGIDVNYHDKVFELFKRMDNVKDFEGTGVGLAIVKRIIDRHNARIWFESELGKGTTFYLGFKK
jgi:chemotaxis family two-component system sensor kinase Cph1